MNDCLVDKFVKLTLYNIPEDAAIEFNEISRRYSKNSFAAAFLEMIERFYLAEHLGQIEKEIIGLKARIEELEGKNKKEIKTFGKR